jgi:hypothetical protein
MSLRSFVLTATSISLLLASIFFLPKESQAMPEFAQATGLKCSACHTMVPLLNAYGRYVQRTGYSAIPREQLDKTFPIWIEEAMNYDSAAGAGTGTPRYDFGNLAIHAIGYALPDVTYHVQVWVVQGSEPGGVDTMWAAYNHLGSENSHLFVGKVQNPAPSIYSQDSDLDGPLASATIVGEHDWGATYDNRWGTKYAWINKGLDIEAAYLFSGEDLNGATDFGPNDKTFQYKIAYATPRSPFDFGVFGSVGSTPVSTGVDSYSSMAGYLQLDPTPHGRPGFFLAYQGQTDTNPGLNPVTNTAYPWTSSRGFSAEIMEEVFRGNLLFTFRHDFNDMSVTGGTINGNSINAAFNLPWTPYLHGYLETNLGGNSALYGGTGGPQWKGMLWLTFPLVLYPPAPH